MRMLQAAALAFSALIAGCASFTESLDSSLLFRARPADPERLAKVARMEGVEEVRIPSSDGITLHGWLKRAPAAEKGGRYPLVIVFGGVARETSWMLGWGEKPPNWGWLVVNYRGYGLSGGVPSEQAVVEDAKRIYDYAASRPEVDASRIVVLGRSLGSYVAVTLASSRPLAGVILATPFDSIAAVAEERYPFLPMGLLVGGRYDSAAIAPTIHTPALFVIAGADDVTPPEHGQALARAWGGPKALYTLADTGHRGVEWRGEYWVQIARFLRSLEPERHALTR
jgi:pimeloyl-ACP methyl ester carboxylesterase